MHAPESIYQCTSSCCSVTGIGLLTRAHRVEELNSRCNTMQYTGLANCCKASLLHCHCIRCIRTNANVTEQTALHQPVADQQRQGLPYLSACGPDSAVQSLILYYLPPNRGRTHNKIRQRTQHCYSMHWSDVCFENHPTTA
eukprot:16447-Heterococcus_DN1.PRE.2